MLTLSIMIRLLKIIALWANDDICWHISGSPLAQVMAHCLTAPSHHLNQCWLIITEVLKHSPESNFTVSAHAIILSVMGLKIINSKLLPHPSGANELSFPCWLCNSTHSLVQCCMPPGSHCGDYYPGTLSCSQVRAVFSDAYIRLRMNRTFLSYIVNIMAADVLAT